MSSGSWPDAILFDLDGTLVDSAPDIADALNMLLEEHGMPAFTLEQVTTMVGGGVPLLVERTLRALGEQESPDRIEALVNRFLEIYTPRAAEKTRLVPGARDVIENFHNGGMRLGVCTNKPEGISRMILESLGVATLFGAVVGGDTLPVKKPDPAPLSAAIDLLGCTPSHGLMVGDSGVDSQAARAAGIPIILVTFGYTQMPAQRLDNDGLVESFAALPAAITRLRNSLALS